MFSLFIPLLIARLLNPFASSTIRFIADKFPQLGLNDILHREFAMLHWHTCRESDDDLVAFDIYQFDIAAVGPQSGPDLLVDRLLDKLNFLNVGQLAAALAGVGVRFLFALSPCMRSMIFSISPLHPPQPPPALQ